MLTRRSSLVCALLTATSAALGVPRRASARAPDAPPGAPTLRFLKVRYGTFLVELGGVRVLIDPSFAPGLSSPAFFDVGAPADGPESLGRVDVILVTSSAPSAFQPAALARLHARDALCLVGDPQVEKALRFHGLTRTLALRPDDVTSARGLSIRASPASAPGAAPAVGFHLELGGRTLWHTGRAPPLDVTDGPARFAAAHSAEVVLACAEGLGDQTGATESMDPDDALLVARLARARSMVPAYDDAPLTPLGAWPRQFEFTQSELPT